MQARQVFTAYDRDLASKDLAPNDLAPKQSWTFCPACGSALLAPGREAERKCSRINCDFVLYRNPVPIVAVLIVDGDRFLLCRRKPDTFEGGKWCLPCGYMDYHEDFLTAGRREVKEETGLDVEITGLLSVASNFLRPDIHTLAIALLAEIRGGVMRAGDDVDRLGWFSLGGELPAFAFPADRHMVERYFATGSSGAPVDLAYAGARLHRE
ncbi:NUDIX hydrolase [Bradyrhizobium guangdongense]|nr:NUDIX hydrolase [Bradyrhizobium guangdongense]